jgi:hypothetical protein
MTFYVLVLTGCVARFDFDTMQPRTALETPPVYETHTVGQTLIAARPRLCAIEVAWAGSQGLTDVAGPIVLHLRSDPASTVDLARVEMSTDGEGAGGGSSRLETLETAMARFHFSPLPDSQGQEFYLLIEAPQATADHPLRLQAVAHDVYASGSAYADGLPWPGDLTFRAVYDYDLLMLLGDLAKGLRDLWLFLPMAALFLAPGFLLLQFWPSARRRLDGWEQMALSLGLSLSILPFLLLWVTQLGGAMSAGMARLLFGGAGIAAAVAAGTRLRRSVTLHAPRFTLHAFLLALVLIVGLVARMLAVRDLALPAWVDSVHHTVVARIIAESGRVPTSYEPYVAVRDATYHYGFQASVAAFAWLSGKALPQAMLLVGQVFNLAAALQVYLLARWLTRRRQAAFFAALIVALLSTMPAHYVSWGRYTQLSGLLILPVASIITIEAARRRDKRTAALAVLALAGLILTHYRVLAFYVCFVAAWWLVRLARRPRAWRIRPRELGWYAAMVFLALASLMPWVLGIAADLWLRAFVQWGGGESAAHWDFTWRYVSSGFDRYTLTLGAIGAVVSLAGRRYFSAVLLLWMGFLFVVTNPSLLGLPGEGLTNNVAMLITWFMPLAIWCGFLGDELLKSWLAALKGMWRALCRPLATVTLATLSVVGVRRQITIVNPNGVLAIQADQEALAWIENHTPPHSRFLINAQPWQGPVYAGADGGYWIAPLTRRPTTTPPALYPLGDSADVLHVEGLNQQVEALASDAMGLSALLQEEDVDYVYLGALGGPLDPNVLEADPGFRLIYGGGRTRVFEVVEQ